MNEDFEKLKAIGAQKIYEKTHIARKNVEYILTKSFDKIPKIQFRGFISILEREYHLDLSELLDEYEQQHTSDEQDPLEPTIDKKEKSKPDKKLIILILIAMLAVGYFLISNILNDNTEDLELNNSQIESAKVHLDLNTTEKNVTVVPADTSVIHDQNVTDKNDTKESLAATRLEILTKRSLWVGYIDMSDFKKKQIIIQNNLELDPSKNYLLVFGHGMLKIDLGIELKEYHDANKKYFKFEDGELTELTKKEFKKLNKGNTW
ncbi:hypothetical protein [Sulfurimonas sp. HSL-1716]|uniref:hypothetical protein n=1 Tax=Hydrocurvibacter sulfurireducens TaxID=3131937 RepID=UPI0031F8328A